MCILLASSSSVSGGERPQPAEHGGKRRVTNSRQEGNIKYVQRVICCLMKSLSRLKIYSTFTIQFRWSRRVKISLEWSAVTPWCAEEAAQT